MKGIVTKSTGSWYQIYVSTLSTIISARLKGIFRLEGSHDTNPIAVGDEVTIDTENGDYVISKISERKNYIVRQSPKHKAARHIIASNLDQAILVVCLSQPRTSTGFIDRFLVTAEAYNIPTVLVINKLDLYKQKDLETIEEWKYTYSNLGYKVIETSIETGVGIDELKKELSQKRSLLSGHSGVGKSSLMNQIDPNLDLRTNVISKMHQKGTHTTTFAELFFIPNIDAEIIDTPGIKEFGILAIEKYELKNFFREFTPFLNQCKFDNCMHINEPNCSVLQALEESHIAPWRYQNYLNILEDIGKQAKDWELKKRGS